MIDNRKDDEERDADAKAPADERFLDRQERLGFDFAELIAKIGFRYGFVGLYIVKPQFRRRGFGLELWDAAMAYLGGRNVGLDGVIAQQENYWKSGFKLAYRNIRYQGEGGGADQDGLLDLSSVAFDEIARYDGVVFPAPRPNFLRRWIRQPLGTAFGIVGEQRLGGYGVLRACRCGFKIGPLFADDLQIAGVISGARSASLSRHSRSQPRRHRAGQKAWYGAGLRDCTHVYKGLPPGAN
jgi:hypothetical protein